MTSTHLFTFRSNRIDFVDENNCRRILLGLFESLPQITLTLTHHLTHDFRTVDQEERSRLVRYSTRHKGFTPTGWSKQKDTARGLDTDRLEQLQMAQWQVHELTNLRHLLAAQTNVIVPSIGQVCLFVFSLHWVTFYRGRNERGPYVYV